MENVLVAALALVGLGLLVVAAAIGSVVLRGWAASRATELADRVSGLEKLTDRFESRLKLVQAEWADYHSKLDTLLRRGVRLGVLERKDGEPASSPPASETALTRSELLRRHREKMAAQRGG